MLTPFDVYEFWSNNNTVSNIWFLFHFSTYYVSLLYALPLIQALNLIKQGQFHPFNTTRSLKSHQHIKTGMNT